MASTCIQPDFMCEHSKYAPARFVHCDLCPRALQKAAWTRDGTLFYCSECKDKLGGADWRLERPPIAPSDLKTNQIKEQNPWTFADLNRACTKYILKMDKQATAIHKKLRRKGLRCWGMKK